MSSTKSQPLTKDEVFLFLSLVEANPIVNSKATNGASNSLKDATWKDITAKFNSLSSSHPRRPGQLRLKWENLKKNARKRNAMIRREKFKSRDGKQPYIRPDEALDRVNAILEGTCDNEADIVPSDEMEMETIECKPLLSDSSTMQNGIVEEIKPKKLFFRPNQSVGRLTMHRLTTEDTKARIRRNKAIADYYTVKKEKIKLEIEILELQKRKLLEENN